MMHAYDKSYLEKARTALGRMLDFAVYDLHYDIEVFFGNRQKNINKTQAGYLVMLARVLCCEMEDILEKND